MEVEIVREQLMDLRVEEDLLKEKLAEVQRKIDTLVASPSFSTRPPPPPEEEPRPHLMAEAVEDPKPRPLDTIDLVPRGRNGKPKVVPAIEYILTQYGELTPQAIKDKMEALKLEPDSQNLLEYIRYNLSRNPDFFEKSPTKRGCWRITSTKSDGVGMTDIERIREFILAEAKDRKAPVANSEAILSATLDRITSPGFRNGK